MCTSGMINSRAFSGRVRPQGRGDEDGSRAVYMSLSFRDESLAGLKSEQAQFGGENLFTR